jgi:hypothetical protein
VSEVRPESIVLRRGEAIDLVVAVDDAAGLLEATDYMVVLLQLEDAYFLLFDRLYPQE